MVWICSASQPFKEISVFTTSVGEEKKQKKAYSVCLLLVNNRTKDNIWVQHKEISPAFSVLLDTPWLWVFVPFQTLRAHCPTDYFPFKLLPWTVPPLHSLLIHM